MKVYVITRDVSIPMDGTDTRIIGVVSSEEKAANLVKQLEKHPYKEDSANTYYEYEECEVDLINSDNLWGDEENIKQ